MNTFFGMQVRLYNKNVIFSLSPQGKPLMIYANAQTTDCTPASADSSLIFTFKGDVGRRKNK